MCCLAQWACWTPLAVMCLKLHTPSLKVRMVMVPLAISQHVNASFAMCIAQPFSLFGILPAAWCGKGGQGVIRNELQVGRKGTACQGSRQTSQSCPSCPWLSSCVKPRSCTRG